MEQQQCQACWERDSELEVDTHINGDCITGDVALFICPNCKETGVIDFKEMKYCFVCGALSCEFYAIRKF